MANAYERLRVEARELNKRSGWGSDEATSTPELPPMEPPEPSRPSAIPGLDARGRELSGVAGARAGRRATRAARPTCGLGGGSPRGLRESRNASKPNAAATVEAERRKSIGFAS